MKAEDINGTRKYKNINVSSLKSNIKNLRHAFWVDGNKKQVNKNYFPISQPAFTCLKFTIETLEQGVKYVQSQQ